MMRSFRLVVSLSRPYNSLLPLTAIFIGYVSSGQANNMTGLVAACVGVFLFHSVVTIWNDIADEAVDAANGQTAISDARQAGQLRAIWAWSYVLLVIGLSSILFVPLLTAVIRVISLLWCVAYDFKPLQLSRRPIASIVTLFAVYGMAPILIGISLGPMQAYSMLLAVGWGLLRVSLSLLKDYKDAAGDAQHGKKTFLLVYGGRLTARASFTTMLIGFTAALFALYQLAPDWRWLVIAALSAVFLVYLRFGLFRVKRYAELNAVFHKCLKYQLGFDLLVLTWLLSV